MAANSSRNHIKVVVRLRPKISEDDELTSGEDAAFECTQIDPTNPSKISLHRQYYDAREFKFDHVVPPTATQGETYECVARDIVADVTAGFNATIMCYGQTGTGKTFTVFGNSKFWLQDADDCFPVDPEAQCGLVPRAVEQLWDHVVACANTGTRAILKLSFLQIYMEKITDLLSDSGDANNLAIREDPKAGVFVGGLTEVTITSPADVIHLIRRGAQFRATSTTAQNKSSSRSHAMLVFKLEQYKGQADDPTRVEVCTSVLNIVDLAGSERVGKSGSQGLRLDEAKQINKSISALGNCVAALSRAAGKSGAAAAAAHVPFRDSKLTRLLTDSLGGNTRTCLCANVGPCPANYEETFSTLLFASRASAVQTYAVVNKRTATVEKPIVVPPAVVFATPVDPEVQAEREWENAMTLLDGTALEAENLRLEAENRQLRLELERKLTVAVPVAEPVIMESPIVALPPPVAEGVPEAENARQARPVFGEVDNNTFMSPSKAGQKLLTEAAWEAREAEIVHKFMGIISSLQKEINRQGNIIDKLQREKPSTTGPAAAPISATQDAMLQQLYGGLMSIPGFKQHMREMLMSPVRPAIADTTNLQLAK